jgi:hypothetical protein
VVEYIRADAPEPWEKPPNDEVNVLISAVTAFAASGTNSSCFGTYASTTKEVPDAGPGSYVSAAAQGLAAEPGGNPHFAQTLQDIRTELCPSG